MKQKPTQYETPAQLAARLGISTRTVQHMVRDGRLPQPLRLGHRTVRFPNTTEVKAS